MKYPKFLNNNSVVGITAPSCGVANHIEDYERSLNNLKQNGFKIVETSNVRTTGYESSPSKQRAKEFNELVIDKSVDSIMCATGGDFLLDMLPFVDLDKIKSNPKWVMGASDPTDLLYLITTAIDIATLYGHNAGSFDATTLFKSQEIAIEYLKGNIIKQNGYNLFEKDRDKRKNGDYHLTEKVEWERLNGDVNITGRIIGGCLDCLKFLPGTKFDYTKKFINKYKNDGIIWYFDIFSMSVEDVYLTLFQLKEAGWFNYIKGVIVGRVAYPNSFNSLTYQDVLKKIFKDIPIIFNSDIGHVAPKMTIINGSIAHIESNKKVNKIKFELR